MVPPREPLSGSVRVAGRDWTVREEKRGHGEATQQLLVLRAADGGAAEMHIRPAPGREAASLEDVEALARTPDMRWFEDEAGARWEARLVSSDTPPGILIKFISWTAGVREGPVPFQHGLGHASDHELRTALAALRGESSPP